LGPAGKKISKADLSALPPLPGAAALALWSAGTMLKEDHRFHIDQFRRAEFLVRKIPNLLRFFTEVVPDGPDPMAEGVKCVGEYHLGMMRGDVYKLYHLVQFIVQGPAGKDAARLRRTGALRSSKQLFIEVLAQISALLCV
jgi:hypothetical protein